MTSFNLPAIPSTLTWKNDPIAYEIGANGSLSITAPAKTDWFIDPAGNAGVASNAPVALFTPAVEHFLLSAKVTVKFAAMFDAGVLMLYERDDLWAKLCFEYSPQKRPLIVSVVTRGGSDDCNSAAIEGNSVYLRIARLADAFALHYSPDGSYWHLVRYFTLGNLANLQVGFLAQSPTGQGCPVVFSEIAYRQDTLKELRNGE